MRRTTTTTLTALAAALAAAVPAAAAPPSVEEQLRRADVALAKAASLAGRGSDAVAAGQLARADRLTVAASRRAAAARAMQRAANGRKVAAQFQQNAEAAARLVSEVEGGADTTSAKEVSDGLRGRARALDALKDLADRLPAAAQRGVTRAVIAISDAGTKPAETLDAALKAGEVDAAAVPTVEKAVEASGEEARRDDERLEKLAERLPAAARAGVKRAQERRAAAAERAEARSGAANACAAEREADPAAFETKYRTHGDEDEASNAYGMCVSGHSAARPPGPGAAGPPAGTPGGPPSGSTTQQPVGSPSGDATQTGAPAGVPTGRPTY